MSFSDFLPSLGTHLVLTVVFLASTFLLWKLRRKNYPPGPIFRLPLVGHLPFLGPKPYETMFKWKKIYGPIMLLQFGHYPTIVIQDAKMMKEAFSLTALSGRPTFDLFTVAPKGKGVVWSDGPLVAEQRAFVVLQLKNFGTTTSQMESKIHDELSEVLQHFAESAGKPVDTKNKFNIPTANAIWSLFMGQRFKHDDPKIHNVVRGIHEFMTSEGLLANLTVFVPIIGKLFPVYSGLAGRIQGAQDTYDFIELEFKQPVPNRVPGQPRNFKEAYLDKMDLNKDNPDSSFHESQNMFPATVGDVFIGATDTISLTLEWFALYMARFPDVQEKLYREIEQQIGPSGSRLPEMSDQQNCPYARAVVNELIRMSSLGPLQNVHRAMEPVEFHGYHIPKDTLILANNWAFLNDPEVWGEDAETIFWPERFLDDGGKFQAGDGITAFSSGKRSCFGEGMTRMSLFLYCTALVQKFRITPVSAKKEDLPSLEGTSGQLRCPTPHKIIFHLR